GTHERQREHEGLLRTDRLKMLGELGVGRFHPAPGQGKIPPKCIRDLIQEPLRTDREIVGLVQESDAEHLEGRQCVPAGLLGGCPALQRSPAACGESTGTPQRMRWRGLDGARGPCASLWYNRPTP